MTGRADASNFKINSSRRGGMGILMKDFQNYLLITDLDGTFLGKGGRLVPRNLEALARFRAGGGLFTIATGRVHLNIRAAISSPETLCSFPAVLSNGAYLYDFQTHRALHEQFLPAECAERLIRLSRERFPDVPFRVSTPNTLRIEALTGYLADDARNYDPGALEIMRPAEHWRMDDWYKIVYRGEEERVVKVHRLIETEFCGQLTATRSGRRAVEIQNFGCSKASGIVSLGAEMSAEGTARRVIACGDFENDIEMLQAADIAVCPENALPQVKALCDHVLCACDEGLIADVIAGIESGRIR